MRCVKFLRKEDFGVNLQSMNPSLGAEWIDFDHFIARRIYSDECAIDEYSLDVPVSARNIKSYLNFIVFKTISDRI